MIGKEVFHIFSRDINLSFSSLKNFLSCKFLRLEIIIRMDLRSNQLENIPVEIWRLPKLQFLNLSNNKITNLNIPNEGFISPLEELNISINSLSILPPELCRIATLKILNITKLPAVNILPTG